MKRVQVSPLRGSVRLYTSGVRIVTPLRGLVHCSIMNNSYTFEREPACRVLLRIIYEFAFQSRRDDIIITAEGCKTQS